MELRVMMYPRNRVFWNNHDSSPERRRLLICSMFNVTACDEEGGTNDADWSKMYFRMGNARTHTVFSLAILLACCTCAFALDPSLDISQYAHSSWKIRDGFPKGVVYSIAQTLDGYLWLGTEFGLVRFDGVRAVEWQPGAGRQLPSDWIRSLLVSRDGTLWIGTQKGLASWKDGKLKTYAELSGQDTVALFQEREGTVWVGTIDVTSGAR